MVDTLDHRFAEAQADRGQLKEISGGSLAGTDYDMIVALSEAGQRDRAVALLRELKHDASKQGPPVPCIPAVFAAVGDKDRAIACLEEAVQKRADWVIQINANPVFDPLRADPRFQELARQVGAPR